MKLGGLTSAPALVLVLMGASLHAVNKPEFPATEVFDKVLAAEEASAWTQADIVKEERAAGDKKVVVSQGHLFSKPGGFARLVLTAPSAGLIVCNGKSLWVELPEVQQVLRYSAAKLKQSGNFFLDLAPTIRHYSLSSYRRLVLPGPGFDPDKVSALELQPLKPAQAGFEKLRVWVDQDHWRILQVRLDYGGTQSTVKFSHRQSASKAAVAKDPSLDLDPKYFDYKAPQGFEVFDLDM